MEWDEVRIARYAGSLRRQVVSAEVALASGANKRWGLLDFKKVFELVGDRGYILKAELPLLSRAPAPQNYIDDELRIWYDGYVRGLTVDPPLIRPSGERLYDQAVAEFRQAVCSHFRALRRLGATRGERRERPPQTIRALLPDDWTSLSAIELDHDGLTVSPLIYFASAPRLQAWPKRWPELANGLHALLTQVPPGGDMRTASQALDDVLDLPIWRKRYELYSVWVATQIVAASGKDACWIVADGVLSFSFAGSKVAIFALKDCVAELWAEYRQGTALQLQGRGRKRAVQPDYTVLRGQPDSTGAADAGLIIECKHYRKAARKSFQSAIADYAGVHNHAHVALVNYTSVAAFTPLDRSSPAEAIGEVKPGGVGMRAFHEFVRTAFEEMDTLSFFYAGRPSITVQLSWEDGGDLDLFVVRRSGTSRVGVSYARLGVLTAEPWMVLDADRRAGPASEKIEIGKARLDVFEIYVHRYEGPWPTSSAVVVVTSPLGVLRFEAPAYHPGDDWWHVCDFHGGSWAVVAQGGMCSQVTLPV